MNWTDFMIAEKKGLVVNKQTVDNIQTTSKARLSTAGWYRVAEMKSTYLQVLKGNYADQCDLYIKQGYVSTGQVLHHIEFAPLYADIKFIVHTARSKNTQTITKVRHTYNENEGKAWLEVYYQLNVENQFFFDILNGLNYTGTWKAITPTLTSETVDGVTVTTTYDIPANASPVTDLDLVRLEGTETLNTSILEKAVEVANGVHNFMLGGDNYTGADLPHSYYTYSMATIYKRSASFISVVLWGGRASKIQANYCYKSEWTGWKALSTTADLENYLPLSGGTVTNTFNIKTSESKQLLSVLENGKRRVLQELTAGGKYNLWDSTNGKAIITSTIDGTNTFNGTATGNLPLKDGVISNSLSIRNTTEEGTTLELSSTLRKVYLQVTSSGGFRIYDSTNGKALFASSATGNTNTIEGTASGNLPLTGGTITSDTAEAPLVVKYTKANKAFISFSGSSGVLGWLGYDIDHDPALYSSALGTKKLLHTGNSAKVAIQESAPTDTKALWVW